MCGTTFWRRAPLFVYDRCAIRRFWSATGGEGMEMVLWSGMVGVAGIVGAAAGYRDS